MTKAGIYERHLTDDDREAVRRAILAALQAAPAASEVDRLPENYELSHGPLNGDMSDCAWQVHSVNGGYNDREWTLVATGETPSEAIRASLDEGEGR